MKPRRKLQTTEPLAAMVLTTRDSSQDKPIFLRAALSLLESGAICQICVGGRYRTFAMIHSTADILADHTVPFSRVVLDAIQEAQEQGAKL